MRFFNLGVFLLILTLFVSKQSEAKSRIAFLEIYNSQGQLVQYEPNSRFGHTAIQSDLTGDLWLNAHPGDGVRFINWEQLNKHGHIAEVIEIDQDIDVKLLEEFLGKKFDYAYSWSDDALYCSELIGKLLHIPPQTMHFNHKVWPPSYWHLEGMAGLSPDQLWRWAH